jgi:DNA-binding transcriptional MerR regulator
MPTPAEVARRANVSVQTIRNWSADYAVLLSPQARGKAGPRLFSDEDVDTLCTIATLRRTGMQPAEIITRIQADNTPPVVDVAPTTSPQTPYNEPQGMALVQSSTPDPYNALQRRMDGLERTQHTLLRAALLWGVLLGAIGAFALGAFVLWVMYLATG